MEKTPNVIVLEDEDAIRERLTLTLNRHLKVHSCRNIKEATKALRLYEIDAAIIDVAIDSNPYEGLEFLEKLRRTSVYPIILSSDNSQETKKRASDLGAMRFFEKDKITPVKESNKFVEEVLIPLIKSNCIDPKNALKLKNFYTSSKVILDQFREALKSVAPLGSKTLILGETGVGKSLFAKALHKSCGGDDNNFVHISSSQFSQSLFEAEFFGFKKGAFTGAHKNQKGFLDIANGGTLFLDEIDTLPISIQEKILVTIETGEYYPLGEKNKPSKSKFRLVTATNKKMSELIESGKIRDDFYRRIRHSVISIPPLRERPDDVLDIINNYNDINVNKSTFILSDQCLEILLKNDWMGNTRTLLSVLDKIADQEKICISPDALYQILEDESPTVLLTAEMRKLVDKNGLMATIKALEEEVLELELTKHKNKSLAFKALQITTTKGNAVLNRLTSERKCLLQ